MPEYGEGRTRLYRDIGKEKAFELGRYNRQLGKAETAQREDVESGALWDFLGSVAGAGIGYVLSGGNPYGAMKGWTGGGEAGKWGQRAVSGYDPEDYAISTDPGKFDVSQRYDFEDVNKQFADAERARFWKDVTGTGISIASMIALGAKGKSGDIDWTSPWDWFSKETGKEDEVFVDLLAEAGVYDNPDLRLAIDK